MYKDLFKLEDIIEVYKFQKIQDDIAKATDMAILTVDYKGVPFTGHSQSQAHCARIRERSQYRDMCQKCDSRGGLEAARLQHPYIYICHQGLVDLAVPIIVNGQYLGAMMAGQVRLCSQKEEDALEQVVTRKSPLADPDFEEEIKALRNQLPQMSLQKVEAIASMLFHICQYIVEEAILKARLTAIDDEQHLNGSNNNINNNNNNINDSQIDLANMRLTHAPETLPLERDDPPIRTAKDDLLKPALDYMDTHLEKHIYVEAMATLCNLSVSYFSKCFNKATGMSFAAYQNHKKIEKAVEQLQTSNITIAELSYELGFETSGYFIKLFKLQIGVTPAVYRENYQSTQKLKRKIKQSQ